MFSLLQVATKLTELHKYQCELFQHKTLTVSNMQRLPFARKISRTLTTFPAYNFYMENRLVLEFMLLEASSPKGRIQEVVRERDVPEFTFYFHFHFILFSFSHKVLSCQERPYVNVTISLRICRSARCFGLQHS